MALNFLKILGIVREFYYINIQNIIGYKKEPKRNQEPSPNFGTTALQKEPIWFQKKPSGSTL